MGETAITGKMGEALAAQIQRAKEEKRMKIMLQISQWNEKLNKANSQKEGLKSQQANLNTYLGEWDTQKTTYNGNDILTDVVILNVFEGVCADKIKEELTASVTQMDQTYSRVSTLNDNVGLQISRLDEYITFINEKITTLNSELNSI